LLFLYCVIHTEILIPIVIITTGITIRIAITIRITTGITITIGTRIKIRKSMGITIRIIIGGRITGITICIRIKMGIAIKITMGLTMTISITIQIAILKGTMTSEPTVVGKWGRHTHGQANKMDFAHTTA
jgi:hypothetical protein